MDSEEKIDKEIFPATVVEVINRSTVAINRGSRDGIEEGDLFSIYGISEEEIEDPETGESLGYLEIFKGKGEVINTQERMSTIKSIEKRPLKRKIIETNNPIFTSTFGPKREVVEIPEEPLPFNDPKKGDKAKPI